MRTGEIAAKLKRAANKIGMAGAIAALLVAGGIIVKLEDRNNITHDLVQDGKLNAVLVGSADDSDTEPVRQLRQSVWRATGEQLAIVEPGSESLRRLSEQVVRISLEIADLDSEQYQIATEGKRLVFRGGSEDALLRGVVYFLDRFVGVRWLWPGELGTYVPKAETIGFPDLQVDERPDLELRLLRVRQSAPLEGRTWLRIHGMGSRTSYAFGHAFTKWWSKYGQEHPDYFASPPEGQQQVREDRIKLDISNEDIDDVIIREWREAGMPVNWNVSPNDGSGFCVSPGCLAMDEPPDQSVMSIWRAEGQLTARYVKFWNRLLNKMRMIRPDVTLSTYAYSSYKSPPPPGLRVDGFIVQVVGFYTDYDQWEGWSGAGAKLFLRPNWWHTGAIAPNLPLHAQGEFFKFARQRNMLGFDFDTLFGYWATQGPNYYLIARMSTRPDLSVEDVLDEYASAFGQAAPVIRTYLAYWERFAEEAGFNIQIYPNGNYARLAQQYDLPRSTLNGAWYMLPYLMTDSVMAEAEAILDRAVKAAGAEDGEAQQRIAFLREGLRHMAATREVVRYGYEKSRPEGATKEQYVQMRQQLDARRKEWSAKHVIWYESLAEAENMRGIPTHESRTTGWKETDSKGLGGKEMDERLLGL
jgi:hypothetical protein